MPRIIRSPGREVHPIIDAADPILHRTYFDLIRLDRGGEREWRLPGFESVCVVLSGRCALEVGGVPFREVGGRQDIWSGMADSVYCPPGAPVRLRADADGTEVAVAGGLCAAAGLVPFRVPPSDVQQVVVGSPETRSRRTICHILGHNAAGRAGNLLVSELYCEEGCWSGYPPHKHDEDRGGEESAFEEAYHYRFRPSTGFGAQIVFQPDGASECWMTRHGDTVLIDRGHHPTVTSPGHEEYIFTILVGATRRSLVQFFHPDHRALLGRIPGIKAMTDAFQQPAGGPLPR